MHARTTRHMAQPKSLRCVSVQVESEMSSLGETMGAGNTDNTPMKGASLWRHVRMIVNGVRGERSGLAGTVCYRAARWGLTKLHYRSFNIK